LERGSPPFRHLPQDKPGPSARPAHFRSFGGGKLPIRPFRDKIILAEGGAVGGEIQKINLDQALIEGISTI
jgi:hypothetical protein